MRSLGPFRRRLYLVRTTDGHAIITAPSRDSAERHVGVVAVVEEVNPYDAEQVARCKRLAGIATGSTEAA